MVLLLVLLRLLWLLQLNATAGTGTTYIATLNATTSRATTITIATLNVTSLNVTTISATTTIATAIATTIDTTITDILFGHPCCYWYNAFSKFQNCLQEVFFGARNASIGYVEAGYVVAAAVAVVRGSPFRITDAPRKRILERREKVEYGQSHQHAIVRYHAPRC